MNEGVSLKVLIISTNSDEAGAPRHVEAIVKNLYPLINFFVVFGEEGPVAKRLELMGVNVFYVRGMRSAISPLKDCQVFSQISSIVKGLNPDLIHAHSSKAGMLARILALRYGVPCIYTVHGWGWRGLGYAKGLIVIAIEKILSIIPNSYYIFVSKSVERESRVYLNIPKPRARIIYNGVGDVGGLKNITNSPIIFMPARVCNAKDHESLVRAFEMANIDGRLVLCGEGTATKEFEDRIKTWAPTTYKKINCLGQRSDVLGLLNQINIFALISNFEALPISILEAMSAGVAIIASDVGGIGELIQSGKNGFLVPARGVTEICNAIKFLATTNAGDALAKQARRDYLDHFTSEKMANETLNYYLTAVKDSKRDSNFIYK